MIGDYYGFGVFVFGVVVLLCIVILYDFKIVLVKEEVGLCGMLDMLIIVKIYCYVGGDDDGGG